MIQITLPHLTFIFMVFCLFSSGLFLGLIISAVLDKNYWPILPATIGLLGTLAMLLVNIIIHIPTI